MDYTTIEMIEGYQRDKNLIPFFTQFFPQKATHISEKIEFDVKKGKRKMAPFVAPRIGGKVVKRDGYKTYQFTTPKIAPEMITTIDDLMKKSFGENIYSGKAPAEREAELLTNDLRELENSINDRIEWMAREIILEGKLTVTDQEEGLDYEVDYNFTNKDALIGAAKWDNENADPLEDILRYRNEIIKQCGIAPKYLILGSKAYKALKNNQKVKDAMDIRNMNFGEIKPSVVNNAVTFVGKLAESGLEVYTHTEYFVDDNGVEQSLMPENKALFLPDKLGKIEYGAVTQIDEGSSDFTTYAAEVVPNYIVDRINNVKLLRMTSRPLPRPIDSDSWYVVDVV